MSLPGVPYCYGSAATASVPDGGPGVTYQWSLNSGRFLGSSTSPTVTFIPEADTLALTVTATNAQGCSASGTSYILVNRPPVGDFNSVPASVCANGTATISTYANGVSYDWQVIDGEIVSGAGTSAITFRAHNAATVTVRLTKTGQYSCGATYERIIPVTSVDATITAGGPTTFCAGGSVTLTAQQRRVVSLVERRDDAGDHGQRSRQLQRDGDERERLQRHIAPTVVTVNAIRRPRSRPAVRRRSAPAAASR